MSALSYEGKEKYIFVSYAHKDSAIVVDIIEKMVAQGYRVWYDDGIAPGSEWPENIAQHLDGCAVFVAFISNNSIESANCRREVTFALSRQKPFLGILLEQTKMSLGMEMQLSAQQCILRYNYRRESDFIDKIFSSPDLACCKIPAEPKSVDQPVSAPNSRPAAKPVPAPKPAAKPVKKAAPVAKRTQSKPAGRPFKFSLPLLIAAIVLAAALIVIPIVVLVTNNLPLQITEDVSVGRHENDLSLRGKTITAQSVEQLNRMEELAFLYLTDCTIEDGALDNLYLPKLKHFCAKNSPASGGYAFLSQSPEISTLELVNCGVNDQNVPFEALTKLRILNLSQNAGFTDLSPVVMENLRDVNLSDTGVKDISRLGQAKELDYIYCANTPVENIDALASLEGLLIMDFTNCGIKAADEPFMSLSLRELYMGGNGLKEVDGFQNFTVLQKVYLQNNDLLNITWLEKSSAKLQELNLANNAIDTEDVQFLEKCNSLTYLNVTGIPMENLSIMAGKTELKTLVASRCSIEDISALQNLSNLKKLYLDGNKITDLTGLPAVGAHNNAVLDLSFNNIRDISPITGESYAVLTLLNNPIVYKSGDFSDLAGAFLALDYDEGLHDCGGPGFTKVAMLDCPADRQLALKENFTTKLFYMDEQEMFMALEEKGIVYPDR